MHRLLWAAAVSTLLLCAPVAQAAPECDSSPQFDRELSALKEQYPDLTERAAALTKKVDADPSNIYWLRELDDLRSDGLESYAGALADEKKRAAQHPETQRFNYLVARLTARASLDEAQTLLAAVLSKDPTLGLAHAELEEVYRQKKDPTHADAEMRAYLGVCGDSYLADDEVLQHGTAAEIAAHASQLRTRLAKADVAAWFHYDTLWQLEFKSTPTKAQPALQQRIAADLTRLRAANPHPSLDLLDTMSDGYQLTNDSAGQSWAQAETEAHGVFNRAYSDWSHARMEALIKNWPGLMAKRAAEFDITTEWLKRWPHHHRVWVQRLENAPPNLSDAEVKALGAQALANCQHCALAVAQLYATRGIELSQAAALNQIATREEGVILANRALQPARYGTPGPDQSLPWDEWLVTARIAAAQHDDARLRAVIAAMHPPLERAQKRKLDASAAYQLSVHRGGMLLAESELARDEHRPADAAMLAYQAGQLMYNQDDPAPSAPTATAARAWKQAGGTDQGWRVFIELVSAAKKASEKKSDWTSESTPLPPMALRDLEEHPWTNQQLAGKTVVLVAWATWCVPCKAELPHLQKLYEATRGRKDLVIVSLNRDNALGMAITFAEQNHYTFPVLWAPEYLNELIQDSIPFSAIADAAGVVRLSRHGFGGSTDLQQVVLDGVKQVQSGK